MTDYPTSLLPDRGRCTGCGACASGCPKGAIHMLPDREGFLYPTVTDACIQCGHCAHICPVLKQREPRPEPAVFAAWNPNASVRQASTAGGVFPLLAEYILDEGGVVFGAALDQELRVRHIAVKDKAELPRLQGAKPVQSDLGDSFGRGLRQRLFLRPACPRCPYTSTDRPADLTLGIYRDPPKDFHPEVPRYSISLLLVNSAKGAHYFDTLPLKREKLTLDQAVACAGALSAPQEASGSREDFFAAFCQQPFQQVRNRFLSASPLPQPLERLRQLLKHPKEK